MDVANNRISNAAQKMKDGAVELGASVLDRGADLKDAALDKGRAVLNRGADLKDAAVQRSKDAYYSGKKKVKEYHAQGASTISANPYSSVLYAFGAGAIVGGLAFFILSRSSQDDCE